MKRQNAHFSAGGYFARKDTGTRMFDSGKVKAAQGEKPPRRNVIPPSASDPYYERNRRTLQNLVLPSQPPTSTSSPRFPVIARMFGNRGR